MGTYHVILLSTNEEYDITVDIITLNVLIKEKVIMMNEEEK